MSDASEVRSTILELEDDRQHAMLAGDVGRLDQLLSDDLVYMHTTGDHDTKESYLAAVRDSYVEYKYLERLEEHVVVHGEVAYITGHHIGLSILDGLPRLIDSFYLAIWKVVDDRWRFCAWQSTANSRSARH